MDQDTGNLRWVHVPYYVHCASVIVGFLYNNKTSNLLNIIRAIFLDDHSGNLNFHKFHHQQAILKTFKKNSSADPATSEFCSCCNANYNAGDCYDKKFPLQLCSDYTRDHYMGKGGHLTPHPLILKTLPYAAETNILIIAACAKFLKKLFFIS